MRRVSKCVRDLCASCVTYAHAICSLLSILMSRFLLDLRKAERRYDVSPIAMIPCRSNAPPLLPPKIPIVPDDIANGGGLAPAQTHAQSASRREDPMIQSNVRVSTNSEPPTAHYHESNEIEEVSPRHIYCSPCWLT